MRFQFLLIVVVALTALPRAPANGTDDPFIEANSLDRQVHQLFSEGRYKDAIPLAEKELAIRERTLGPEHRDVAERLNNLAWLYVTQRRYAEAEPLYQRSLKIYESALVPDDLAVAKNLKNLANMYEEQARYAEAEPLYKRSLAIREKAQGPESREVAESLNKLAGSYRDQARYAEAEPLLKRSLAIFEKARGPEDPIVAALLNNLAALYVLQGRYTEAEPLFERSLAIAEKTAAGPEGTDVAHILNDLARLYDDQGRYAEAETLYKRSLAIFTTALGSEDPTVATSCDNLAELYAKQGRYSEAEPLFRHSLAISEKTLGAEHPNVAVAVNNLADMYRRQGRNAEAEPLLKRSLAIREKLLGPEHPSVATALGNLALLYVDEGRFAEAEPLYKRGLAIDESALGPEHPDVVRKLYGLAWIYAGTHREAEAYPLSRRAVEIMAKRISVTASDRSDDTAEQREFRRLYFVHVGLAFLHKESSEPAAGLREGFRAAQLAQASGAARAVAGMAARFAAGNDALAAVVRERQDSALRWQRLDKAIVAAASKPPEQRNPAAEADLRRSLNEVGARLDALDTQIAQDFPTFAELSNPKPLELPEARALLAPDEAMLVYFVGADFSYLWAIRHDQARMFVIKIGAKALAEEVAALRSRLDPDLNPDLQPYDAKRAYALYQTILAPAAPLLEGAKELFVVPDGALQSLPFGVLVTQPPAANPDKPEDHRALAWFARDFASTVLPSVGALRELRNFAAATRATAPFVGIGDPVLAGRGSVATRGIKTVSLFRGAEADVDRVRELPPLPETADELRAVAKALGAGDDDLYLAERASEPLLRMAGLDRYRIVEFATHGLMSGDLEGLAEPALVLTPPTEATRENDGLLTASKIATLKLDADWVVLSACNTAASDGSPDAGGLSGLAKAFFYAGARSILVSHWSVPSQATVKLVTGAFDELAKNPAIGRAEALRRAEIGMLSPASPPEFAHPMFWASFVLAGEGAGGR